MEYGELGRYPFDIIVQKRMIAYWSSLASVKETKLGYLMYNVMLSLYNKGKYMSKWINNVKKNLGMSHVWMNQEGENINLLKENVVHRI